MGKYPIGLDKRWDLLIRIANLLWGDADRLIRLRCFMETSDAPEVTRPIIAAGHEKIGLALKSAFVEAIVMRCARACDSEDGELHSIPAAQTLLADPATFDRVAESGDRNALTRFLRLTESFGVKYSHQRVRHFRSYSLVHHLTEKAVAADKATFDDLWTMTNDVILACTSLAHGTGLHTLSAEGVAQIWKPRCAACWKQLAK